MATAKDILADMGIELEEVIKASEEIKQRKPRDRRICLCGHGIARHSEFGGREACSALHYNCKCRKAIPILTAEDIRPFICRTEGSGALHALSRGIAAAAKRGQGIEWVEENRYCHSCETAGEALRLTPVAITNNGFVTDQDTGYNALLCPECRIDR